MTGNKKLLGLVMALLLGAGSYAAQGAVMPATANAAAKASAVQSSQAGTKQVAAANATAKVNAKELKAIRVGNTDKAVRLVMDLTRKMEYTVTRENDGRRLVVTVNGVSTAIKSAPKVKSSAIKDLIFGTYGNDTVQLIVDMPVALPTKVFALEKPDRIIIDVEKKYEKLEESIPAQGLNYKKYVRYNSNGMLTAYVLEADPASYKMELALAGGNIASGRSTVKNIATDKQAVAAVNGGYFDLDGSLIGDNRVNWQTAGTTYFNRSSLGEMPDGNWLISTSKYSGYVTFKEQGAYLSGVNCARGENTMILYNRLFGSTTKTNEFGMEYVVQNKKIVAINQKDSKIPADGLVLSVHGKAKDFLKNAKVGDNIEVGETFGKEFQQCKTIIGAGPELLRDGMVNVTVTSEQFPKDIAVGKAPRTAIGFTADGHYLFLVVDGRQSISGGTTLTETAQLLQKFGAVRGINLDGGGSSELVLQGKIMNSPSDGSERRVGSAVVLSQN